MVLVGKSLFIRLGIGKDNPEGCPSRRILLGRDRSAMHLDELFADGWRYPNGKKIPGFNPRQGDMMGVSLPDGNCAPVILTEVTETTVAFDANHPLAGQDLTFEIALVNIL